MLYFIRDILAFETREALTPLLFKEKDVVLDAGRARATHHNSWYQPFDSVYFLVDKSINLVI